MSGLPIPALLNMMSRPPKRSTAKSTSAWTWSSIAHIGLLEGGRLADPRGDLLAAVRVDVRDDDARPLGHEQLGGRLTDTARTTRHDRNLPGKLL